MSESAAPTAPTSAPSTPTSNSAPSAPSASGTTHTATAAATQASKTTATPVTSPNSKYADATRAPEAGQPSASETETQRRIRLKLKIDGAEKEEELTPDEIAIRLQKAYGSDKRFQEAAEQRKKVEQFWAEVKKDPKAAFKELAGVDIRKQIEDELIAEYQAQQLPEHERAILEAKREADKYKQEVEQFKAEQQRVAMQQLEERVQKETEAEFGAALERSQLPKDRNTLRMMAEVAIINLDNGVEMTPDQLAAEVSSRMSTIHKSFTGSLKGESLVKYLGDDVVNEVLRFKVEQARAVKPFTPPAAAAPSAAPVSKDDDELGETPAQRQRNSYREFKKFLRDT